MRTISGFAIAILALALIGCSQSQPPPVTYAERLPAPIAASTPAPADAHGCTAGDWHNARSYQGEIDEAREMRDEEEAANRAAQDAREAERRNLDDRADLEAKIVRHFLNVEGDPAARFSSLAIYATGRAADDLAAISPKCRDWLLNGK